eukprot:128995-Pyramimonas_sp.AAC.1
MGRSGWGKAAPVGTALEADRPPRRRRRRSSWPTRQRPRHARSPAPLSEGARSRKLGAASMWDPSKTLSMNRPRMLPSSQLPLALIP